MSLVPFDSVTIDEQREPMVALNDYPFIAVPVYHHYLWSPVPELFLRRRLADKLLRVQERELDPRGLRWVVYDAWRPRSVQAAIYQHYWRQMSAELPELTTEQLRGHIVRYVTIPANPNRVPAHSTGGSVDLGLWDCAADCLLNLGSEFDDFSPAVAGSFYEMSGRSVVLQDRRRCLAEWLMDEGIVSDADEWFHKDYGNQKWAWQAGLPRAVYGEVLHCARMGGQGGVEAVFGSDESEADRAVRIASLQDGLDLSHPATQRPALLVSPADLVRAVAGFADLPF